MLHCRRVACAAPDPPDGKAADKVVELFSRFAKPQQRSDHGASEIMEPGWTVQSPGWRLHTVRPRTSLGRSAAAVRMPGAQHRPAAWCPTRSSVPGGRSTSLGHWSIRTYVRTRAVPARLCHPAAPDAFCYRLTGSVARASRDHHFHAATKALQHAAGARRGACPAYLACAATLPGLRCTIVTKVRCTEHRSVLL